MTFDEFLESLLHDRMSRIKVTVPCRILTIDSAKTKADVRPLLKMKDEAAEKDYPVLQDVPIQLQMGGGYYVRIPFEVGDIVTVLFGAHDMSSAHKGFSALESDDIFALSNAVIIAGAQPKARPSSWSSKNGLLIGNETSFLQFTDTDILAHVGPLKYSLTKHKHPTAVPGPPSPPQPES